MGTMTLEDIQSKITEMSLDYNLEEIKEFIMFGMVSVTQFHIYHLMCGNGTHHDAIGKFYIDFQDELDSFTEAVQAHYNMNIATFPVMGDEDDDGIYEVELYFGYDYSRCFEDITSIREYVSDLYAEISQYSSNASLIDKLQDMQEICDKLIYKLKLT